MQITECLWPLYCLVQSPNSVTQHFAELSADPVYINRLTTCIQIMALLCPSIVCNRQLSRVSKQSAFKNLVGLSNCIFTWDKKFFNSKRTRRGNFQHFFFSSTFCAQKNSFHTIFLYIISLLTLTNMALQI